MDQKIYYWIYLCEKLFYLHHQRKYSFSKIRSKKNKKLKKKHFFSILNNATNHIFWLKTLWMCMINNGITNKKKYKIFSNYFFIQEIQKNYFSSCAAISSLKKKKLFIYLLCMIKCVPADKHFLFHKNKQAHPSINHVFSNTLQKKKC